MSLALICLAALLLAGASTADSVNTIDNAPVVALGQKVSGQLARGNTIYYRVSLPAGASATIKLTTDDPSGMCMFEFDPTINDSNYSPGVASKRIGDSSFHTCSNDFGIAVRSGVVPVSGLWTVSIEDCDIDCSTTGQYNYTLLVTSAPPASTQPKSKQPPASPLVVTCCDSFVSGEGTQAFPAITNGCHRTDQAWPNLLPYPAVNVACSGAKIRALFTSFKGQAPQLKQMEALKPGIVVMMDGGNDALYSAALRNCYVPPVSCAAGALNQNFAAIRLLRGKLAGAYEAVVEATHAKLFAVVYPRVFPLYPRPIVNCGWLNNAERLMLTTLGNELQQAEVGAVADANKYLHLHGKARIQLVSASNVLAGHELCSSNSWMFKINFPACAKDSRCGHPTALGQAAIASVIAPALRKYTG